MCGIAVIADSLSAPDVTLAALATMHDDLAQRGPDGEGVLLVDAQLRPHRFARMPSAAELPPQPLRVAASFRRLAIRDLRPEANQPSALRQGALWILHNGEIYNDGDLRRELASQGTKFATDSDAETILAAYSAWGEACFARLRGMWATVIIDLAQGRLVVCRDRLGIKPLFYASDEGRTVVASHPRAIPLAFGSGPSIDRARWHRFLRGLPAASAGGSFFDRVYAVPAGALASIDLRATAPAAPSFRRYWSLGGCVPDAHETRDDGAAADELLELLRTSTREHLVGDRKVGCLLSGGLDSSVVACLAAREARESGSPPACFSIVFDDPRMSEWPYIQAVAAHAGITSTSHSLTPPEAWALVDEVVTAHGEPLLGQDVIAHYRAFRLAREHDCVVVLEGQAADELFAGLPSYETVMFLDWLRSGAWGRVYAEASLRARAQGRPLLPILREFALAPAVRTWVLPKRWEYDWLEPDDSTNEAVPLPEGPLEQSADPARLNRFLFDLVRHSNLPAVLLIQDRNAMANGVENRPPFLDHRLVEWAFRLAPSFKVGGGRRKRVLWNAAHTVVPQSVLARTDKRAIVSRRDWMPLRTAHREPLMAMADSPALRQAPFIRGDRMTSFVHAYLRGDHDDGMGVWRLYTGWRWLERFHPAA